jgi:hypothetical protein
VTIEDRLADASATMALMPGSAVRDRLRQLEAEYRRRSGFDGARRTVELETIELDWGAYELASQYEEAGNLVRAAKWYRLAAAADFSDAALRLGWVLDQRASQVSQREELALVAEAARWYVEAYSAGYPEAVDLLDAMISRSDRNRPRDPVSAQVPRPPGRPPQPCGDGGLDEVVGSRELHLAIAHFQQCTPCQREFLERGGLLPQRSTTCRRAADSGRSGRGSARRDGGHAEQRVHRPPVSLTGDRQAG